MEFNATLQSFSSGEIAPNLWARTDRPFYKTGLEVLRQYIPLLTGGLFFRQGFEYGAHTRLNQDVWGLPYRFNLETVYSLEFTDYKIRFHTGGGVVLETAKVISGITAADPGVVTSTSHGFNDDDEVYIAGVVGMTELNAQFFLVANATTHTFTLTDIDGNDIDTSAYTAYASGGTVARVYEIDSPYPIEIAKEIQYAGTEDVMYICHQDYEPRKLTYTSPTSWAFSTYDRYSSTKFIWDIHREDNPSFEITTNHGFKTGDIVRITNVNGMTHFNDKDWRLVEAGDGNPKVFRLTTLAGATINASSFPVYENGGDVALVKRAGKAVTAATKADPGVITAASHGLITNDKVTFASVGGMTELNGKYFWVKKINANSFSLMDEQGNDVDTSGYTTYTSGGNVYYLSSIFNRIGDFPGAVGFYGGRIAMGSTKDEPDAFWLSKAPNTTSGANQYNDFTTGTAATNAVIYILSAQNLETHKILWFSGNPTFLIAGTTSGVYRINGGANGAAITPTNILATPISSIGSAAIAPIFVENQTIYVEQGGLNLRSFGYSVEKDDFTSFDKTLLAEEMTTGGIVQIAYARGRPNLVYVVRADGALLACSLLEQQEVAGWTQIDLGGGGKALSVVTETSSTGIDRVGVFVERTINGQTRRYLEYLSVDPTLPNPMDYFTDEDSEASDKLKYDKLLFEEQKKFNRLDCSVYLDHTQDTTLTLSAVSGSAITATAGSAVFSASDIGKEIKIKYLTGEETGTGEIVGYTSSTEVTLRVDETFSTVDIPAGGWYLAADTVSGIHHLEGETVSVVADGGEHADVVVTNGTITLEYVARYVILGYKYKGFIRTTDLEVSVGGRSLQGRNKNMNKIRLKVRNTLGGKVGTSFYKVNELVYRSAELSRYGLPVPLFTGLKEASNRDRSEEEKRLCIIQDKPFPMTVLAMILYFDIDAEEDQ